VNLVTVAVNSLHHANEHAVAGEVRPCEKTRSTATEVASVWIDLYLVLWNEAL
jgi:hypothetical protein